MNDWCNNKMIENLYSRGLSDSTKATFSFVICSSKNENLIKLLNDFELSVFQLNIEHNKKEKVVKCQFNQEKDLAFYKDNINTIVGWLFALCSDNYCELKTCGLIL